LKINIYGRLCLAATTALTVPAVAFAQDAAPAASAAPNAGRPQLEDIVVTARRTSEALQDTPVSITAFSEDFLDRQNIQQVDEIAQFTPNLIISAQPSSLSAASILIRGVGQTEPSAVAEPGVGMYLDGVYIARTGGAILDLVELERIEVLRGPQGTLFGRNTIGGAVQLVSRVPSDEPGVIGKAGYGSFDTWYGKATVDTGYIGGSPFKATVSYLHRESEGWVNNRLSKHDPYGINSDSVWVRVRGDISDKFTVDYSFDWNDRNGQPAYFQLVGASPAVAEYYGRSESLGGDPFIFSRDRLREGLQEGYTDRKGRYSRTSKARSQGHALTLQYEAGDYMTIKSITAYRKFFQDTILGLSGNGELLGVVFDPTSPTLTSVQRVTTYQGNNAPQDQRQWSQEVQVTGEVGDFNYVGGAYYFHEKASEDNHQFLTAVVEASDAIKALNPGLEYIGFNLNPRAYFGGVSESYALFGQVSWSPQALDNRLELTGGLRYTWDYKSLFIWKDPTETLRQAKTEDNLSWLASVNYEFSDDMMAYVRVSTGYKSGGFNPRVTEKNPFDAETVISYEAGIKAEWFDRRFRTNLAIYRTNYDDRQINQFSSSEEGAVTYILNAGKAEIQGVELEVVAAPVTGLTLNGSLGYTDAEFKRFDFFDPATNTIIDVADEARFSNVPKWTYSIGAQYDFPAFDFGQLSAQVDYSYRSKMYFMPLDRVNIFNEDVASPGQGTLNGRLTLSEIALGGGEAELSLWTKNLLDNDKIAYGIDFGGLGFGGAYFAEPRSFGVDLKVRY